MGLATEWLWRKLVQGSFPGHIPQRLNGDNKEAPYSDVNIRLYLEDYSEEDEEGTYEYTQLMEEEEIDNEEKKGGGEEDMTSVGDCL